MRHVRAILAPAFDGTVRAQDTGDVAKEAEAHRTHAEALIGEGRLDEARAEQEKARAPYQAVQGAPGAATMLGKVAALKMAHPEPYFWAPFVYIGDPW